MSNFYITTPIYYVNDSPHIGHLYTTLAADILARFHKRQGDDVFFLTGTDEHGAKVAQAAKAAGKSPQQFADTVAAQFSEAWRAVDIAPDRFIRTTDEDHIALARQFLRDLDKKGEIYQGVYEGLYCVACETYYKQEELLAGGLDPVHQKPVERIKEDVWFFKLSTYQKQLIKLIKNNKLAIEPESRRNEVLGFLHNESLEDIAITRSKVAWGIPVPWDTKQTFYVWIEALLNYLTAAQGKKIWPPTIQIIGKDILRFHAVIWPALLIAAGIELPKKLFVHGFFTIGGAKMSKTAGNVIAPAELTDRYGVEATRILLFTGFDFGEDGDFSLKNFDELYNAKLANDLGNLLQRTVILIRNSKLPARAGGEIRNSGNISCAEADARLEQADFRGALNAVFMIVTEANQYIDEQKPWALDVAKDRQTIEKIFTSLTNRLLTVAAGLEPFAPGVASAIREQLKTLEPTPLFPKISK
ncbi:methionine--tRNA ligase [Candidatus Berkelbacteria bacterium]|nr:methionine--tRNA ligase [Candidatus Berkelbacteria bacterium]